MQPTDFDSAAALAGDDPSDRPTAVESSHALTAVICPKCGAVPRVVCLDERNQPIPAHRERVAAWYGKQAQREAAARATVDAGRAPELAPDGYPINACSPSPRRHPPTVLCATVGSFRFRLVLQREDAPVPSSQLRAEHVLEQECTDALGNATWRPARDYEWVTAAILAELAQRWLESNQLPPGCMIAVAQQPAGAVIAIDLGPLPPSSD